MPMRSASLPNWAVESCTTARVAARSQFWRRTAWYRLCEDHLTDGDVCPGRDGDGTAVKGYVSHPFG
jgi:hypothetical protein